MVPVIHDRQVRGNGLATRGMPMVLMYHSVQPYTEDPYLVTVQPPRFEQQMRWLSRRGWRGVSMAELLAARAAGAGKGLIGLTFDDGYADFAEHALPVLRRYGFTATVFVIAGRLGGDNAWDPAGPRKPLLGADQVRRLAEAGVEIGSHGLQHVSLTAAHGALAAETGAAVASCRTSPASRPADSATRTGISTPRWSARSATRATTTAALSGRRVTPGGTRCRAPTSATPTPRPGSGARHCGTG